MNATKSVLCLALVLLAGCKSYPNLLVTEVGEHEVEIFLQEDPSETLSLNGVTLHYASSNGDAASVHLFGDLNGGEHLVVWESPGYTGVPVDDSYTNWFGTRVRGIAVAEGTFGTPGANDAFALRLQGRHQGFRVFIPHEEEIEDKALFGAYAPNATPPVLRPDLGGTTYTEDGSTVGDVREPRVGVAKAKTIQRRWGTEYDDNARESDLRLRNENFGTHP